MVTRLDRILRNETIVPGTVRLVIKRGIHNKHVKKKENATELIVTNKVETEMIRDEIEMNRREIDRIIRINITPRVSSLKIDFNYDSCV